MPPASEVRGMLQASSSGSSPPSSSSRRRRTASPSPTCIAQVFDAPDAQGHPAPLRTRSHQAGGRIQQLGRSHRRKSWRLVQPRGGKHALHERLQPFTLVGQQRTVFAGFARAFGEHLSQHADGGDRRAELVADPGDECLLARHARASRASARCTSARAPRHALTPSQSSPRAAKRRPRAETGESDRQAEEQEDQRPTHPRILPLPPTGSVMRVSALEDDAPRRLPGWFPGVQLSRM